VHDVYPFVYRTLVLTTYATCAFNTAHMPDHLPTPSTLTDKQGDASVNTSLPDASSNASVNVDQVSTVPLDLQDERLESVGAESIFQRVRLLTPRQRIVLDKLLSGAGETEACEAAGYTTKSPIATIQSKLGNLMDRLGLTDEYLVKDKLIPLLNATETKAQLSGGTFVYSEPLTAHDIRLRALDMALKLKRAYPQRDEATEVRDITVQVIHIGGSK